MGEWIELAYGEKLCAPKGMLVELHYPTGATCICRVGDIAAKTSHGTIARSRPRGQWGMWPDKWRPVKDDGQSEAETRKARMDQFYKIAAGKDHLIEETLKPRERVS